jgi:hypothetical protein
VGIWLEALCYSIPSATIFKDQFKDQIKDQFKDQIKDQFKDQFKDAKV